MPSKRGAALACLLFMSLRALHKQMQECIGALRGEMGQIRDGSGELGRRYAGGGDDGAAISHHDALRRSAGLPGVEGGTAPRQPLPPPPLPAERGPKG